MSSDHPLPRTAAPGGGAALPLPLAASRSWARRSGFRRSLYGDPLGASGYIVLPRPPETLASPDVEGTRANGGHARGEITPLPASPTPTKGDAADFPLVVDEFMPRHVTYELRNAPGIVQLVFYALQHYVSIMGSLVLVPLVVVPAMGGTDEDAAKVVSTILFISGVTTLLHTSFGTRLPLIQGPSFVFLAPVLAIVSSQESQGLNGESFRHIMKQLQGAIIISSAFQAIMGYTGLMSMFLRYIKPVVVASTIAAVGLSFFSYGFTIAGSCIEIGLLQILLVFGISLYLCKIQILGHRIFLIYAVPLSLLITWAIAFLLTECGVYSYKDCDINIPVSNTVSAYCRENLSRMKHCRVDTSHALSSSPWLRFPYPLQWGIPVFSGKLVIVMSVVSMIASVDSVGSYHASSLFVASRPPTAGVLSRGIGMEGVSSVLAGLWGTGFASTTLTENVHTIAVTRLGSRRAVELGAVIMILLSLIGKVGGFIASIPDAIVAGLLCFMWALLVATGLSNLRSATGSSRNSFIVGISLFFSLSIPSYFQQYGLVPNSNSPVPSYFQPYAAATHGPFRTSFGGVNYILNTLLSLNMVIAFLISVILENTVPGSPEDSGVYEWSESKVAKEDPAVLEDYRLPFGADEVFKWVKWVGL